MTMQTPGRSRYGTASSRGGGDWPDQARLAIPSHLERTHLLVASVAHLARVSRQLQQPDPQHDAAAGLVARTNALMNVPSTCFASVSTSRPSPERKARASSTAYSRVGSMPI